MAPQAPIAVICPQDFFSLAVFRYPWPAASDSGTLGQYRQKNRFLLLKGLFKQGNRHRKEGIYDGAYFRRIVDIYYG